MGFFFFFFIFVRDLLNLIFNRIAQVNSFKSFFFLFIYSLPLIFFPFIAHYQKSCAIQGQMERSCSLMRISEMTPVINSNRLNSMYILGWCFPNDSFNHFYRFSMICLYQLTPVWRQIRIWIANFQREKPDRKQRKWITSLKEIKGRTLEMLQLPCIYVKPV